MSSYSKVSVADDARTELQRQTFPDRCGNQHQSASGGRMRAFRTRPQKQ